VSCHDEEARIGAAIRFSFGICVHRLSGATDTGACLNHQLAWISGGVFRRFSLLNLENGSIFARSSTKPGTNPTAKIV
jgi:hypothetical protein